MVHEDWRPEQTVLGCAPALNAGVQEDIDFIKLYPVITIESCEKDCAAKLVEKMGDKATVILRMPEVIAEIGADVSEVPEKHVDCEHPVVQAVARRFLAEVDRLLKE